LCCMKVPGARLIDALKTALKICFRRGEKFWLRQAIPTCMLKGVPLASNFRISKWASSKRIAIAETSGDDRP
jgi:hypothetical protein